MEKNAIRHIWTVLCKNTIREILKNLRIPIQLELITLWSREDSEGRNVDAKMQILDPQGKVLLNQQYHLAFEKGKKRLRFRMRMDGIIVSISGEYLFVISTKEGGEKNYQDRVQIPVDIKITE